MQLLIAIDDTDNEESMGTGKLSGMLAEELEQKGLMSRTSVTRHQLLVHPDIPYTSHNSCACIEGVTTNHNMTQIADRAKSFLVENFHQGANPGLCVRDREAVPAVLRLFGRRAQREVLSIEETRELAGKLEITVWWQGETGQGCIGAMAGVGLRSTGEDGRFIGLSGIREIKGRVSVGEVLGSSAIQQVLDDKGGSLQAHEIIDTRDWVRPSLHHGQAVLFVVREEDIWRPVERRKRET